MLLPLLPETDLPTGAKVALLSVKEKFLSPPRIDFSNTTQSLSARACFIAFVLIELIKYVEQSTAAAVAVVASAVCARLLIQICRSPPDLWPFRCILFACAATESGETGESIFNAKTIARVH